MALAIEQLETPSPAQLPLEIVERKGLGHPETKAGPLGRLAIPAGRCPGPVWRAIGGPSSRRIPGRLRGLFYNTLIESPLFRSLN
jgi:hypothetical protein